MADPSPRARGKQPSGAPGHSSSGSKGSALKAYSALPVAPHLYKLPAKYSGWEYRSRATATSPTGRPDRQTEQPRTCTKRPKPAERAAECEAAPPEAAATADAQQGDSSCKSPTRESRNNKVELTPTEKLDTWISHHHTTLLGALSSADQASKGLLKGSKIKAVLVAACCPQQQALEEAIEPIANADVDYAKFIACHKATGQRAENRKRAVSSGAKGGASTLEAVKTLKTSPEDPRALRSELARIQQKVRQEKEKEDYEAIQHSLEKIHFDEIKTPFAKTAIRDAYLTYSPSKKSAAKALQSVSKTKK